MSLKGQLIRLIIQWMIFLNKRSQEMIQEKYIQLCIAHQFGGINTIEFTQTLTVIKTI